MTGRAAVFLDRDGTLIEDSGYLADPGGVRLIPGAAEAVARFNRAGLAVVVVTNQSGIARGLVTEAQYYATERRLDDLLQNRGARIEAHYFCPHHPDVTGACDCRKPALLLYRRAAERFGIDLMSSWWIGDRLRDVQPATALGGRGILVLTGGGREEVDAVGEQKVEIARDLAAAADAVLLSITHTA